MNKKFLSAILFGALMVTSTGTFVSCKDYDDDIDNINKELTDIKSKLADLESKVSTGGVYVTKIESVAGGLKVSVSDGTSYNLTVAGTGAGSTVVINKETGEISIDGETTGYFAVKAEGETSVDTTPYVQDGFWYLWDKEAKKFVKSDYKAAGNAWAVQKGDVVVLHIPNEAGVMQEITLPTSASALTALDVTPSKLVPGANIAWSKASAAVTWAGAKKNVTAGQLLIGQLNSLVETATVSPKSYDLGAQKLTLVDVDGKDAPVNVIAIAGDAEATAPRAASMNGEWTIGIEMGETITADNIATAFTKKVNGVDKNVKYALAVNGTVMSGYEFVIDTQTEAESKTNKALADNAISGISVDGETTTTTIPLGTTVLSVINPLVYDSYIKFEGLNASKAEKAGITVDGMTITAPATAAGINGLTATIYVLDVTGHISKSEVAALSIAGATEAPSESVSPVNLKLIQASQAFTIDLGDTFASLDANQALSINGKSLTTNSKDFFALTSSAISSDAAPYDVDIASAKGIVFKNAKDEEVTLTGSSNDLRSIKKAVVTLNNSYTSGATNPANMFGSFTLTLTLKNGTNAVKAIEIPVTVEEPKFDDLFEQNENAAWKDDVYSATLAKNPASDGNKDKAYISLDKIFVSKKDANGDDIVSGVDVAYTNKVKYTDYDGAAVTKDDASALFANLEASGANILKADGSDGSILVVKNFKTTATANVLQITYDTNKTYNVTVTSPEFTVTAKSIFEGASLVYYNAGASVDAVVNAETEMIAPLTGAGDKRAGLALKLGDSEMAVNYANLTASKTDGTTDYNVQGQLGKKFTVIKTNDHTAIPNDTYKINVTISPEDDNSFGTVTLPTPVDKYTDAETAKAGTGKAAQQAENEATGIKVADLKDNEGGTLLLKFKDELGIITTATIKYKK